MRRFSFSLPLLLVVVLIAIYTAITRNLPHAHSHILYALHRVEIIGFSSACISFVVGGMADGGVDPNPQAVGACIGALMACIILSFS
jgi:hypothetical protein